jgi:hypothetical protein
MNITVQKFEYYGNTGYKPVCDIAKALTSLAKQKTLTQHNIDLLINAGINITFG